MEKLTNCEDDTCKFVFIMDRGEILGSVMAVQYTNDTWMVQHIVTSPTHKLLTKELVLRITSWMAENQKMNYFINYFQEKTRWAYKSYHSILNHIGGSHIAIESFDYYYIKLSEYSSLPENRALSVQELNPNSPEYKYIYNELLKEEKGVLLNTLGLKEHTCSIDAASENYTKMGISRKRKYLTVKQAGRIVGFSFVDISSYGISLSLLLNTFHIFIIDSNLKQEVYNILINAINKILKEYGKIYSIGIIRPRDGIFLEKIGYQRSRSYLTFTFSRDNHQFTKILDFVNGGRK